MTLQAMVETVRNVYPDVGVTQVIGQINTAIQMFVEETFILDKVQELTLNALITEDGDDILTNEGDVLVHDGENSYVFTLPADCLRVYLIETLDPDGTPTDTPYEYKIEHGELAFWDFYNHTKQLLGGDSALTIKIHYYYLPTDLTSLSSSSAVPSKFHEGILADVFRKQALLHKDSMGAKLWNDEYRRMVHLGKIFANDRMTVANIESSPEYF